MPPSDRQRGVDVLVLCQVEVEQERLPLGTDQDVRRLDVAVEDAPLVGMWQPLGDLRQRSRPSPECSSSLRNRASGSLRLRRTWDRWCRRLVRGLARSTALRPSRPRPEVPGGGDWTASRAATNCHAPGRSGRSRPALLENAREAGTAEIGHADRAEPGPGRPRAPSKIGTMLVCCNWARVCGSVPSMAETLSTTGRPARSDCSARKTRAKAPRPRG